MRRGKLERDELDLALAVLPRYGGRMGDTLISMGLVGPVDIFRAIREQGRDRVADLFLWNGGHASRSIAGRPRRTSSSRSISISRRSCSPASRPPSPATRRWRSIAITSTSIVGKKDGDDLFALEDVVWPPLVARVQSLVEQPTKLRDVLKAAAQAGGLSAGDVLRGLEILVAAGLATWR